MGSLVAIDEALFGEDLIGVRLSLGALIWGGSNEVGLSRDVVDEVLFVEDLTEVGLSFGTAYGSLFGRT